MHIGVRPRSSIPLARSERVRYAEPFDNCSEGGYTDELLYEIASQSLAMTKRGLTKQGLTKDAMMIPRKSLRVLWVSPPS